MKFSSKIYTGFSLLILGLFLTMSSCTEDDGSNDDIGSPQIDYIRSTSPEKNDSLLTGAFMGELIAIVGKDLDYTRHIWFNDQEAELSPVYVTNETILVNVPSTVPGEVNNKMRMVFADETEMEIDFSVNVPGPILKKIKSEFVETGDIAVLTGDFFFEPTTVIFPGDIEAEISTISKTQLEVIVPEGTDMGEIVIKTNFGTAVSTFLFRDSRNMVGNGDDLLHRAWNAPILNEDDEDGIVENISGNYIVLRPDSAPVGAWSWQNSLNFMYIAEDAETGRGNFPIFPGEANVNEWGIRFEINVQFEWREIPLEIFFGEFGSDHMRESAPIAQWSPWEGNGLFETDGWETVTVPLKDFNINFNGDPAELGDLQSLTNLSVMLFGAAENTHDPYIALDNLRVVRL